MARGQVRFDAISDGKKVFLSWTAPPDRNYDYFTVERSKEGTNFSMSMLIKGAGAVNSQMEYSDIDYSPYYPGISYYRLKLTDYFGQVSYSNIIPVNFKLSRDGSVQPNGAEPEAPDISEIAQKEVLVVLRNSTGTETFVKLAVTLENSQLYGSNDKDKLAKGVYLVVASSYNCLFGHKLIIK